MMILPGEEASEGLPQVVLHMGFPEEVMMMVMMIMMMMMVMIMIMIMIIMTTTMMILMVTATFVASPQRIIW